MDVSLNRVNIYSSWFWLQWGTAGVFMFLPLFRESLTEPKANNAWTQTGGGQTAKLRLRSSPQRFESALKDSQSGLFLSLAVQSNRLEAGRPIQLNKAQIKKRMKRSRLSLARRVF